MLSREAVEGEQHSPVFGQFPNRLVIFRAVGFHEEIEGGPGFGLRFRLPDIMQVALGFGLHRFGHGIENVSGLVNPAPLLPGAAEDFAQRRPEPP